MRVFLNPEQFYKLLDAISGINWTNIASQIIVAVLAAGSGFYIQYIFERKREKNLKIEQTYRFNEAVGYMVATLEDIAASIEQLLIPSLVVSQFEF